MKNIIQNSILNLFILMDFPIHFDTVSLGLSILYLRGHRLKFLKYDVFLSLESVLI